VGLRFRCPDSSGGVFRRALVVLDGHFAGPFFKTFFDRAFFDARRFRLDDAAFEPAAFDKARRVCFSIWMLRAVRDFIIYMPSAFFVVFFFVIFVALGLGFVAPLWSSSSLARSSARACAAVSFSITSATLSKRSFIASTVLLNRSMFSVT